MKIQQMTLISCLAFNLISCGLLESKSNGRSPRSGEAAPANGDPNSGDVVVDEGEPAAKPPVDPTVDPAMALTGKDLYAKLCANCHGKFEESEVGKTPLNRLKTAIESVPDMAGLKDSKEEDLEAIVIALKELPPAKGGKPEEAAPAE
jgi:mono/diheme cytochrome c family protein